MLPVDRDPPLDQMLVALTDANPGLVQVPNATDNYLLHIDGAPAVPGTQPVRDSLVSFRSYKPSFYQGKATYNYRRINLAEIAVGQSLLVRSAKSTGTLTFSEVIGLFNAQYPVQLTVDDLVTQPDQTVPAAVGDYTTWTLTAKPDSLGYTGNVTLRWMRTALTLKDTISQPDVDGRVWPVALDVDPNLNTSLVLNAVGFGIDFSTTDSTVSLAAVTGTSTGVNNASLGRAGLMISEQKGYQFTVPILSPCINVPTTSPLAPLADRSYAKVVIVTPNNASRGIGQLYLHYNT